MTARPSPKLLSPSFRVAALSHASSPLAYTYPPARHTPFYHGSTRWWEPRLMRRRGRRRREAVKVERNGRYAILACQGVVSLVAVAASRVLLGLCAARPAFKRRIGVDEHEGTLTARVHPSLPSLAYTLRFSPLHSAGCISLPRVSQSPSQSLLFLLLVRNYTVNCTGLLPPSSSSRCFCNCSLNPSSRQFRRQQGRHQSGSTWWW